MTQAGGEGDDRAVGDRGRDGLGGAEPGGPEGVGAGHELDREGPVGPGGAEGVPGAAAVVAEREARPQRVARAVEGAQGDPAGGEGDDRAVGDRGRDGLGGAEPGGPEGVGAGHELDREGPVGPGGAEGVPGAAAVVAEREARPQRVARAVEGAQGDPAGGEGDDRAVGDRGRDGVLCPVAPSQVARKE